MECNSGFVEYDADLADFSPDIDNRITGGKGFKKYRIQNMTIAAIGDLRLCSGIVISFLTCIIRELSMLSARNQFMGTVKSVKLGNVMAEVVIKVGQLEFVSAITRGSAEAMELKEGDVVTAVIKSTEVLIDK